LNGNQSLKVTPISIVSNTGDEMSKSRDCCNKQKPIPGTEIEPYESVGLVENIVNTGSPRG
jgi:hypothetical protein